MPGRDGPRLGFLYPPDAAEHAIPAPAWELRDHLLALLQQELQDVFDDRDEERLRALVAVLNLHRPWRLWRKSLAPVGVRYEGVGCRSCRDVAAGPCLTVAAVAAAPRQQL